ncbi:MAG: hypothetical protein J6Q42_01160 [Clostridia bacterium]|nr:hypothetical protein [Clostridia bacterium]
MTKNSITVAIAFLLSLLAFGCVFVLPLLTKTLINTPDNPNKEVSGTTGKQRTIWLLFHDEGTLLGTVAVVGDTRTLTLQTIGIPAETEITSGTQLITLQEAFQKEGEKVAELLAKQTEMDIDGTITLSVSAVTECIRRISGNLSYTLTEPVGRLPASTLTLTPLQIADIFRYNQWSQGVRGRAQIYAELTALFLEKALKKDTQSTFGILSEVSDSRLHISGFVAIQDDLALLKNTSCTSKVAEGKVSGNEQSPHYVLYH